MGVYHIMGVGLSPGVVLGPVSYIAMRQARWKKDVPNNIEDKKFFERSGEIAHREGKGKKEEETVGDIQAIVLITSKEVIYDREKVHEYIDNQASTSQGRTVSNKVILREVIKEKLKAIAKPACKGREELPVYWITVDRYDLEDCVRKVSRILTLLSEMKGGQGKEIWINLTGGNNLINLSLQITSSLLGKVGRYYYISAKNDFEEKCILYTKEQDYWIDIPSFNTTINLLTTEIMSIITEAKTIKAHEIHSRLLSNEKFLLLL